MLTDDGRYKFTKETKLTFPIMKTKDEKNFLPIFTDGIEYAKKFRDGEWEGAIFTFQDILKMMNDKDGIIINPFGQRIVMPRDRMAALEVAAKAAAEAKKNAKKTKKKATITDFREVKDGSKADLTDMKEQLPETDEEIPDVDGAPLTETNETPIED